MVLMDYSGARGTLIHEKKLRSKILCQITFNYELPWLIMGQTQKSFRYSICYPNKKGQFRPKIHLKLFSF
jgi:hypothetical protein